MASAGQIPNRNLGRQSWSPRPTEATLAVHSGRAAESSAPTKDKESPINHPGQRRGGEDWVGIGAEIIPKVSINFGQSLSHGCAVPAPFTQGSLSLRGTGDADCRVALLLAMTVLILCHSEEAQRADVGIRPFYDGRGFGPPSRRPLRVVAESRRNHPGSALSAEREAGQIRSLPDDLGVQHGVQGSEV